MVDAGQQVVQGDSLQELRKFEAERLRLLTLLEGLDPNNVYVKQLKPFFYRVGRVLWANLEKEPELLKEET